MRKNRVHNWRLVLGVLGILSLAGCDMSLQEALEAGMFDFVAGSITDTLVQLVPVADAVANGAG